MPRLIIFAFCICSCLGMAMDPTLARGVTRVKLTFASVDAHSFFDYDELGVPLFLNNQDAEYNQDAYALEYTYGLSDDMAIVMRSSSIDRMLSSSNEELSHDGISGYYLALRQAISVGQGTRFYTETGVNVAEESDDPLPLSAGGTSWYALFSYNQDFLPSKASFSLDFGYVIGGGGEDEVVFGTELVLDFLRVVDLRIKYNVLESKEDKKEVYLPQEWPKERGYQQLAFQLERDLGRSFRVSLGYQNRFRGRNQFDTSGLQLGVSYWFGGGGY